MRGIFKKLIVAVLTAEAKLLLRRTNPTIIAITGNVGKTSTKDAIYTALKDHVSARKSEKSFNSELGVPLSVLGLSNAWNNPINWMKNMLDGFFIALFPGTYPKVLVLEMGVDRPGDMKALTSWVRPDIVVLTRLPDVPVHIEYFATPEAVIAEKMILVEALKPEGVLVYNHDDENIRRVVAGVRQQAIGYSRYSPSHFTASGDTIVYQNDVPAGLEFTLTHLSVAAKMKIEGSVGVPHIYSYAAAAAVASLFEVALPQAMEALRSHTPTAGRMRLVKGLKDTIIIDDTYNSSPVAAERALSTLKEIRATGRRVAVLGDMLELGQYSVRAHERVGEQVAECADVLITIGIRARKIAESALEHGISEKQIYQYDDVSKAVSEVQNLIKPGDVVLIKASQGIRAEKLVEEIMAYPEEAEAVLVRQDTDWRSR